MMWYDELSGVKLTKNNAKQVAQWIEGECHLVEENGNQLIFVIAKTSRGDIMVREGDWIAKDADERFRIVRIKSMDIETVLEKAKKVANRNILQVSARNYKPRVV